MPQALVGSGGFLAAALWMNLMFDFQALGYDGVLPADILARLAGYYRHIATDADPLGNVLSLVMILTVLGAVMQLSRSAIPLWVRIGVVATAVVPALYGLAYLVPLAERLGSQAGSPGMQSDLARSILWGHLVSLFLVGVYLGLQILAVQHLRSTGRPQSV